MANSNKICRAVLDTRDVIKNQLSGVLMVELVSNGTIDKDACRNLTTQLAVCVDKQTDTLVDRILNEFRDNK